MLRQATDFYALRENVWSAADKLKVINDVLCDLRSDRGLWMGVVTPVSEWWGDKT